ncbi:BTB/POZ domain-containing adapter for CUL3-mediated RhoA degradation protein 3-like [Panonychus citri]|uniref:BTB/POZ domain-containing adapter for CUL3-mediated RhoA degradation protein 3-like n=1 Tax=Panonychus citri TaxID=50023 RepID=UPI0023080CE5|nr:BTB/POZ domain-containing adapter for CUL3-mediated RhoA degradation protein 3-like [Panonychus citri]
MTSGENSEPTHLDENLNLKDEIYIKGDPGQYVKLNVGGSLFQTTIATLTRVDCMLRAMFSGQLGVHKDSEGWIRIDRDGEQFGNILKFLRDGKVCLPESVKEINDLLAEANFLIQELIDSCEAELKRHEVKPICQIVLITSPEEEIKLIKNSVKPVVLLSMNRGRPQHSSYSAVSHDNFLKHWELFNKFCLKSHSQFLFVLNEKHTELNCCWSFYYQGESLSRVASDGAAKIDGKIVTNIVFREGLIYDSILDLMLISNQQSSNKKVGREEI